MAKRLSISPAWWTAMLLGALVWASLAQASCGAEVDRSAPGHAHPPFGVVDDQVAQFEGFRRLSP